LSADVARLQRAMTRVCLGREVSAEDLALLGGAQVAVYRDLVRSRFRELVSKVLPRTEAVLGRPLMNELFEAFLAEDPPRSRYFREVVPDFLAFVLPRLDGPMVPSYARDVALLEGTRWELGWRSAPIAGEIVPFELEKVPAPHPTLRVLKLGYAVHRWEPDAPAGSPAEPPAPGPTFLSVHRRVDHLVETRTLDATGHALLVRWARADRPAIEAVREVLAAQGRAPDTAFVDSLGALLAALVEAGALLGSRP
jgi:hypothetical protein